MFLKNMQCNQNVPFNYFDYVSANIYEMSKLDLFALLLHSVISYRPTECFAVSEPQNPPIDVSSPH